MVESESTSDRMSSKLLRTRVGGTLGEKLQVSLAPGATGGVATTEFCGQDFDQCCVK